ncbi:MAG: iron-containing alcohol dehydrogenase [Candidatus Wallbacteria bacterium]
MEHISLRKFVAPEIVFGVGARKLAGRYAKHLAATNVLLVTDPGVINAGWTEDIKAALDAERIKYRIFSDVSPNPRSEEVMRGAEVYNAEKCDAIISVGGGSPMDCAKGIGIVATNKLHVLQFEGVDKIRIPGPPFIFIPTTAGTSADVSQFSIILNEKELVKIAIISKSIVPDISLIDPETTITMDHYLTACTGMDALTHAVEAFVSKASSPLTDVHAVEAIKILSENLETAVKNPNDITLREKIMFASMEAGLAFSNAILGAVHSMAHSLGGFLDLPHGECNAILLSHVINFNYTAASDRYNKIGELLGIKSKKITQKDIVNKILEMKTNVGILKSLSKCGVKESDLPTLAAKAHNDPCLLTNPRQASKKDLEVIYEEAF